MQIERVSVGNKTVAPIQPLFASVSLDEADALYLADVERLGVSVHAETREMLAAAIEDEIAVLWSRYACAPDDALTPAAAALKRRVLSLFIEVPDAAQAP
jgi:hypothetical protein